MWRRVSAWAVVLTVTLSACSGEKADPEPSTPPGSGAETAVEAVEDLVSAINEPDFVAASGLAMPGQAALASLAEGAGFSEVAEALAGGDQEVAANFWAGFAQGAGSFLTGSVTATEGETISEEDLEFHTITVELSDGGTRTVFAREDDGFRIDLFASFGRGLAEKMLAPTERLLTTQTEDARLILGELQKIVPSLLVAASLPGTSDQASQQLLALIEVITRVG